MAIRMRRGNEADFDPSKMLPGEWAVSTDTKYVRMCFSPGIVLRMATYEAFESDMAEIRKILSECQSIQTAVKLIQQNVTNSELVIENYVKEAKQYRDEAEQFRNEAFSTTPEGYEDLVKNVSDNTVKIDTIIEKAELNIKNNAKGSNIHLTDSAESNVVALELYGKTEQNAYTGKNLVDMSNPIAVTNMSYNKSTETYVQTATDTNTGFLLYIRQLKAYDDTTDYKWVYDSNITTAKTISCTFTKLSGYNAISIKHNGQVKDVGVFLDISHLKDDATYYFKMNIVNATQGSIEFGEIIISETESDYEPYVGGKPSPSPSYPQEIKSVVLNTIKTHGKNLIKGSQTFEDFDRMSIWTKETETYNGLTVLSKNTAWNGVFKKNFYVESGKTYTFSAFVKTSENHSAQLLLLYANISTAEISINSKPIDCTTEWKRFSITFTCTKSGLICPRVESITDGVRIYVCGYQVEESPTMTEYQPYQETEITLSEPIELNGFNDVYDVVTSDGVTRRFGVAVLDGTESYRMYNKCIACNVIDTLVKPADSNYTIPRILCEKFIPDTPSNVLNGVNVNTITVAVVKDTFRLRFHSDIFSSVEDAISYFSANPTLIVYELATPTTEELQSNFTALKTFYPETYVSNDADCDMSITYTADAKNYIDNKIALLTTAIYNNI